MKNRFSKILVAALALALLLCAALALSVSASTTPEIISQNIEYGEKFSIMYAVDANTVADGAVTLAVYAEAPADGVNPLKTYTVSAPQTETINGEAKSVYIFTTAGVSAKDFADVFYAQATDAAGNKSAVVKYSVVQYMLERLYGGYDITPDQKDLYTEAIEFGAAAQDLLAADDAIKVTDYNYVRVVGGTVNGVEKAMFVKGETVTLSANAKGWQATVNGETVKLSGTSYVVAGNALIETYNRPLDLTTSYFTTQKAAGETTLDYTKLVYWTYCTHNTAATKMYFTNSSAMGDALVDWRTNKPTATFGFVDKFADGNEAFRIGKHEESTSANISQTQFLNVNSADKNCFVFESDIMFDITTGAAVEAGNVDKNNNLYVSRITVLANPTNDRNYSLYDGMMPKDGDGNRQYFEIYGEYDFETTTWKNLKIADQTFENGKWYKMVVEYYKAEGVMKLYIDGYLVSTIEGLAKDFVPNVGLIQLQGLAYGSSIYVDNTYVGTVDKTLAK